MLRTVLIDDEPNAIGLLSLLLSQYCPQIAVVASCTDSREGVQAIKTHKPDVVFLDIEMPQLNGFQVLEAVADESFSLVFVTAYDKFALKAFRYSALDYLLKPINVQELQQTIARIEQQHKPQPAQVETLRQQWTAPQNTLPNKIALPYQNGVMFVEVSDIIYCESENSYTRFHLADAGSCLVTKPLSEMQELLEERDFMRVHRQFLINLNHIRKFVKGEGSYLQMSNQQTIPVSRLQKDRLMQRFGWP